mmetsp:Transcript_13636/g.42988  ORF Transcript_13636/g.42988 Transcript_13636/m.42988 type:complete len:202 (-) Transcript_13636:347-952(-)
MIVNPGFFLNQSFRFLRMGAALPKRHLPVEMFHTGTCSLSYSSGESTFMIVMFGLFRAAKSSSTGGMRRNPSPSWRAPPPEAPAMASPPPTLASTPTPGYAGSGRGGGAGRAAASCPAPVGTGWDTGGGGICSAAPASWPRGMSPAGANFSPGDTIASLAYPSVDGTLPSLRKPALGPDREGLRGGCCGAVGGDELFPPPP